ncbi:Tfp pilus assembly protein FimT/FimU [Rheinheimera marina]|uniref:Tfp pilus assembly protein FimT/FimU n=1 Tax=Rheinheimera marina TaxID=1774958 RepID=A0ABV9JRM6_9GAMM
MMSVKSSRGFTLIELMIVIMLLGLVMSLVGPLTMQQVDSARARSEQESLQRWLRQQSFEAYTRQQAVQLSFDGKGVYAYDADGRRILLKQFSYLFFTPQHVELNVNGFPEPVRLQLTRLEQQQDLDLLAMLTSSYAPQ